MYVALLAVLVCFCAAVFSERVHLYVCQSDDVIYPFDIDNTHQVHTHTRSIVGYDLEIA